MDDEDGVQKPWETEYERTWEAIQEDAEGHLQTSLDEEAYKAKRRKLFERPDSIRLGMMRHVFVILDCSKAMEDHDLRPDRLSCSKKVLEKFLVEFFDQNPISQVGIILTRNGRAEKLIELNGNPRLHIKALSQVTSCSGDPSLQNALEMAMRALRHVPNHASKEVLVVMGSLCSCDPGNIFTTIEELVKQSVRCSIIGLAAEVRLCKTITQRTQGTYSVILDEIHFRDIMLQQCHPPPAKGGSEATAIKMGFPKHQMNGPLAPCLCHVDQRLPERITTSGYFCPRDISKSSFEAVFGRQEYTICKNKYCELPVECKVCGLTLVLAPHLARSYHHLFPLPMFSETSITRQCICAGCQALVDNKVYRCPRCDELFCIDCDLYIHETLHNCPGCTSHPGQPQALAI